MVAFHPCRRHCFSKEIFSGQKFVTHSVWWRTDQHPLLFGQWNQMFLLLNPLKTECGDEVIGKSREREQLGRSLLVLIIKICRKQLYYCKIIDKNMSRILLLNKAGRMMTLPHAGQEQKNYDMSKLSWDMTGTFSRALHVNSLSFVKARAEELMLPTFGWCRGVKRKLIA